MTSERQKLEPGHTREAISRRLSSSTNHTFLKDFVYGSVDGSVTTFAIVAGIAGASLSSGIVLILGFANLIADGFSMAAGNYLGTKAENDRRDAITKEERRHIELIPEGEREEVRQIYERQGFSGEHLEHIVEVITSDDERWVATMLQHEHGLSSGAVNPIGAALVTFFSFITVGIIPILVYVIDLFYPMNNLFAYSCALTGLSFFLIGSFKSIFTTSTWIRSGLETFLIGSVAAFVAYSIGYLLRGMS